MEDFDSSMEPPDEPTVVCLCGSTRFGDAFAKANLEETLAGRIVLTIGCNMKSDSELFGSMSKEELARIKTSLDELHKRKIDIADEILVLNVGGYIGDSTKSEIEYAGQHGKSIRWLEPPQPPQPAPVPKLVDACEITLAYVRNMDTEAVFESFHAMELALAAEKRRQKLVDELIRVAKTHYHKADNLDRAIQALDAFDKERGV